MIISHRYKFVFISVPRTASRAVRAFLKPYGDVFATDAYPFYYHVKACELRDVFRKKQWAWDDYFKFAFVRNPWSRTYSQYSLISRHYFDEVPVNPNLGFEDWCRIDKGEYVREMDRFAIRVQIAIKGMIHRGNMRAQAEHIRHLWDPQSTWVKDAQGKMLVDYVGRFETLEEDLAEICRRLSIEYKKPDYVNLLSGVKQPADPGAYKTVYTDETRKIIQETFTDDIETFGYHF